ncbi:aldehyde oxidoreductase [Halobellus salinus]|uniref:Aldehyde oxidoreductase n=1 Tax=Halobellus salinus TaxID=931585 RepID=A0A830ESA8_9EURY|nr:aldo/keto reductase [Halobellus salinus]GGJ16753.1 aldehyde oxidoreductase [Halobellus salinus]SMP31431.1 Aldo/keto reductase [Halobellus salinus]
MEFPPIGLGTYRMTGPEACADAVARAVDLGYDHVDTAQSYGNETFVADGLAAADRDADDVFVATKLDTANLGYDDVLETARESADRLGVDSLDLLYVHWPLHTYDPESTLPALDAAVEEGIVGRIGLSNFRPDQLRDAMDRLANPIAAHQVEMHPLLPQPDLRELAVEHGHELVAYCPIARNQVGGVDRIVEVAERHDATPAQVSLAWLDATEGVTPIPKAASPAHIRENLAAVDLELDGDDIAAINGVKRRHRIVDFDAAPWNQA